MTGGFANIIILLAKYAAKSYATNAFEWDLVRSIFMVESHKNQKCSEVSSKDSDLKSNYLYDKIRQRRVPTLNGVKDIILYKFCKSCKKKNKEYDIYQEGMSRIRKLLDISHLIKTVWKVKIATRILLAKH